MAKDSHLIEINLSEVLKGSNDESTYTMEAVELYRYIEYRLVDSLFHSFSLQIYRL